jgi:hypothetical protein
MGEEKSAEAVVVRATGQRAESGKKEPLGPFDECNEAARRC